jgi:hypothetical protein
MRRIDSVIQSRHADTRVDDWLEHFAVGVSAAEHARAHAHLKFHLQIVR